MRTNQSERRCSSPLSDTSLADVTRAPKGSFVTRRAKSSSHPVFAHPGTLGTHGKRFLELLDAPPPRRRRERPDDERGAVDEFHSPLPDRLRAPFVRTRIADGADPAYAAIVALSLWSFRTKTRRLSEPMSISPATTSRGVRSRRAQTARKSGMTGKRCR